MGFLPNTFSIDWHTQLLKQIDICDPTGVNEVDVMQWPNWDFVN